MIYIYRPAPSASARLLAQALGGRRIRRLPEHFAPNDRLVCWGASVNGDFPALNKGPIRSKFNDALKLKEAGVPTVEVRQERPVSEPAPDPLQRAWEAVQVHAEEFLSLQPQRGRVLLNGLLEFSQAIGELSNIASVAPPAPAELGEWLARRNNHVGGNDLLNPPERGDYFVKKEDLRTEFRVHSFQGRSIRSGVKRHRDGFGDPHPWIRSWDGGWRISYDGRAVRQRHRDLAHAAIQALDLDFGAVDIGEKGDGSLVVLEVNRAPGLEGGSVDAYARAIRRWTDGE